MRDLPPLVRAFMADHIRTLDELQLLITCLYTEDRWWDATAVARELGLSTVAARHALDHLASRNLFDIRITGDVRYRFRPGTEELYAAARVLAETYRADPAGVINLVAGAPRRSVRDFADAFRVRKDDDR
jgi:hypothetical protein